jgi:hypothetical protein
VFGEPHQLDCLAELLACAFLVSVGPEGTDDDSAGQDQVLDGRVRVFDRFRFSFQQFDPFFAGTHLSPAFHVYLHPQFA